MGLCTFLEGGGESVWGVTNRTEPKVLIRFGNFLDTTPLDPPPSSKVCKTSFAQNPGRGAPLPPQKCVKHLHSAAAAEGTDQTTS